MSATPDTAVLEEAAGWLVRFQSETLSAADRAAFERWRGRSAAHAAAWARVEDMLRSFGQVPPDLGARTLRQLERPGRRQALRSGAGLLLLGPAAWLAWRELPWHEWSADARTATGEQRRMQLADGTRLLLNTATAVDIQYTAEQRVIWLRAGEILLTTGKDPAPVHRPFIVRTAQGSVQALGTRFMVRDERDGIRVAVFEGAVAIRPAASDAQRVLRAGQQTVFDAQRIEPESAVDTALVSWEDGMLAARNWRLADLVAELARYRRGFLRCDPAVAELRVSGAFPLNDIDAGLRLLEKTLPVRIQRMTPYWVTVAAR
ncbi:MULTISPECIES: FecR domain-containing protein [Achromobacter]|uniref:FecR domain-containing protein n=1 Tax=Achromobacter TaxID=222 RepID=UPI0006C62F11|nr:MULTISPECIES: FecR domain-containing protein [Achromobacter]CAB3836889.1 Protein FecR [Achromobacter insuavis]CUJ67361.1 fec operon regulator FecR [Achromobacter sp. 2789STDY5608621]